MLLTEEQLSDSEAQNIGYINEWKSDRSSDECKAGITNIGKTARH